MSNRNLDNEDIEIIKSYIDDGYSDNEIYELADYTIEQIKYVRKIDKYAKDDSYSRVKGNRMFSDQTINVFCKFLDQGCSNENLYDIFQLWHKIKRESFYKFCDKLRRKETYTHITKNYDIPLKPTRPYESKFLDKDFVDTEYEEIKKITKSEYDESKRLQRKKSAELDRIKTQEAIKRKEEELKAKENSTNKVKPKESPKPKNISESSTNPIESKVSNDKHTAMPTTTSQKLRIEDEQTGDDAVYSQISSGKLPNSIVNRICKLIMNGFSDSYISHVIGVSQSEISAIRNGTEYVDISKKHGIIPSKQKDNISDLIRMIE